MLPRSLWAEVIALAHEGHQGEDRTIRYLRERVWFPKLSEQVREYVKTCEPGCTSSLPAVTPAPIVNRETPEKPWDIIAADYKGPQGVLFPCVGGHLFQVARSGSDNQHNV